MNRKFIVMMFLTFVASLIMFSCSQPTADRSSNSINSIAESAKSMENSARSLENSAKSLAESANSIKTQADKNNANLTVANTNSNSSNTNLAKPAPTSSTGSVEDDVNRKRYEECVRQRTAFGADTSPCSEWARER